MILENLKTHTESIHQEATYPRDVCHYRSNIESDFKKHVEATHKENTYDHGPVGQTHRSQSWKLNFANFVK